MSSRGPSGTRSPGALRRGLGPLTDSGQSDAGRRPTATHAEAARSPRTCSWEGGLASATAGAVVSRSVNSGNRGALSRPKGREFRKKKREPALGRLSAPPASQPQPQPRRCGGPPPFTHPNEQLREINASNCQTIKSYIRGRIPPSPASELATDTAITATFYSTEPGPASPPRRDRSVPGQAHTRGSTWCPFIPPLARCGGRAGGRAGGQAGPGLRVPPNDLPTVESPTLCPLPA